MDLVNAQADTLCYVINNLISKSVWFHSPSVYKKDIKFEKPGVFFWKYNFYFNIRIAEQKLI